MMMRRVDLPVSLAPNDLMKVQFIEGLCKGALAIECQTYSQLVSLANGPKKKNGGLKN